MNRMSHFVFFVFFVGSPDDNCSYSNKFLLSSLDGEINYLSTGKMARRPASAATKTFFRDDYCKTPVPRKAICRGKLFTSLLSPASTRFSRRVPSWNPSAERENHDHDGIRKFRYCKFFY